LQTGRSSRRFRRDLIEAVHARWCASLRCRSSSRRFRRDLIEAGIVVIQGKVVAKPGSSRRFRRDLIEAGLCDGRLKKGRKNVLRGVFAATSLKPEGPPEGLRRRRLFFAAFSPRPH